MTFGRGPPEVFDSAMTSVSASTANIGLSEFEAWTSPADPTTSRSRPRHDVNRQCSDGDDDSGDARFANPTWLGNTAAIIDRRRVVLRRHRSRRLAGQHRAGDRCADHVARPGDAMPVGDLPGWKQVFADDFATDVTARLISRSELQQSVVPL